MLKTNQGRHCPHCQFITEAAENSTDIQKSSFVGEAGQSRMSTSSSTLQQYHVENISESSSSEGEDSFTVDPRMELRRPAYARAVVDLLNQHQQFEEELLVRRLAFKTFPRSQKSTECRWWSVLRRQLKFCRSSTGSEAAISTLKTRFDVSQLETSSVPF